MKKSILHLFLCFFFSFSAFAQNEKPNLIIITTDGLRWQEVFSGMDEKLAGNAEFNMGDSALIFERYGGKSDDEKRKKLLPFLWTSIEKNGVIFGNRTKNSLVNVENPYWFSYPGYNELLTGYADSAINTNEYPPNPNKNVLAFLNQQKDYKNHVAAFSAWFAFERILNEKVSGFPVINGFKPLSDILPDETSKNISLMLKDSYRPFHDDECLDVFTHYQAFHYLQKMKPKVLYISYGETDEWAHAGKYNEYLNAAHRVDKWLGEIWNWVQSTPGYKDNTYLLISTDHGRSFNELWTDHGIDVEGSSSIWFALLGPKSLQSKTGLSFGEQTNSSQLYQKQLSATVAKLLGFDFKSNHPVGNAIFK